MKIQFILLVWFGRKIAHGAEATTVHVMTTELPAVEATTNGPNQADETALANGGVTTTTEWRPNVPTRDLAYMINDVAIMFLTYVYRMAGTVKTGELTLYKTFKFLIEFSSVSVCIVLLIVNRVLYFEKFTPGLQSTPWEEVLCTLTLGYWNFPTSLLIFHYVLTWLLKKSRIIPPEKNGPLACCVGVMHKVVKIQDGKHPVVYALATQVLYMGFGKHSTANSKTESWLEIASIFLAIADVTWDMIQSCFNINIPGEENGDE